MKKIPTFISTALVILWFIYGVIIIARGNVTLSDWVVTWIGLMIMCLGNLIMDIERYRDDDDDDD